MAFVSISFSSWVVWLFEIKHSSNRSAGLLELRVFAAFGSFCGRVRLEFFDFGGGWFCDQFAERDANGSGDTAQPVKSGVEGLCDPLRLKPLVDAQ